MAPWDHTRDRAILMALYSSGQLKSIDWDEVSKHWPESAGKPAAAKSIREQVWKYATGYNAQTAASNPSRKRASGGSDGASTGAKRPRRRKATENEARSESEGERDAQEREQIEAEAAKEQRVQEQMECRRQALQRLENDDDEVAQEKKNKQVANGMFVIQEEKDGVVRADFGPGARPLRKIKVEEGMRIMGLSLEEAVDLKTFDGVKIKKEQRVFKGSEILGFQGLGRRREFMKKQLEQEKGRRTLG